MASIHVGGPVAAAWAKGGIAHQRFGDQADQFLAIDGIHPPTIRRERNGNNGVSPRPPRPPNFYHHR
jgi:hypothetical protein